MPVLTLPDGKQLSFPAPVSGRQVAESIAMGLARRAIAVKLDDEVRDLDRPIEHDAKLTIITVSNEDPDALRVLRHSCAHVLAEAICSLYPQTRLAYGPSIDDGFFYDMAIIDAKGGKHALADAEFAAIEAKMAEIVKADRPFTRRDYSCAEGLERTANDVYKRDNAERAIAKGSTSISFYSTGEPGTAWEDLCAGPHVPRTGFLAAYKIMSVAGAYWHGDQTSDQLTRVYGTCFADAKGLKAHLTRIEEAKKRDHRKLGKEMDLFHLDDENPGQIFWHPKGWTIYRALENYVRAMISPRGYVEVKTPSVMPKSLWERSGHWAKYRENMFTTEAEKREFALKPMNCPGHIEIFKQGLKSYRELPLRLAEFGACHRNEPSGALHGIMRVRGFTQDDAHIFCTEEQMQAESAAFIKLTLDVYADFGFKDIELKLSTRPEKRVGSDELWDRAESALASALDSAGLAYDLQPGEGAFYGPKIEFSLKDCLGRVWQCGTLQLDFNLPIRLGAEYVSEDNSRKHPVMLHRAILGSFERFVGILIEHYEGAFPAWLAPTQAVIMNITDKQADFAAEVEKTLNQSGFRAKSDLRNEKIGFKIREHTLLKVPYLLVIGDREVEMQTVAVRTREGADLGSMPVAQFAEFLAQAVSRRGRHDSE